MGKSRFRSNIRNVAITYLLKGPSINDISFRGYQAKGDERRQGDVRGVIKLEKWADVVYGWPLRYLVIWQIDNFADLTHLMILWTLQTLILGDVLGNSWTLFKAGAIFG